MISRSQLRRFGQLPPATLPILWGLLSAAPHHAFANIVPPPRYEAILFHVQSVNPEFCDQGRIRHCDEIQQHTEQTGTLEFDLFVYSKRPESFGGSIYSLEMPLAWPEYWEFVGWEACNGGEGTLEIDGSRAQLGIDWTGCPTFTGEVLLAARFIFDVSGFGEFGVSDTPAAPVLRLGCPPEVLELWWAHLGRAQAGVECGHCQQACDLRFLCEPQLSPDVLSLQVAQDGNVQGEISCQAWFCEVNVVASEDWMTLTVDENPPLEREITVSVDADSLALGRYEGWVRAEGDCVACTRVILTVLPDEPVQRPPVTWGQVKALYR